MAVAHVVGGLSLDEGRLFRAHLLECTACRARVGELRAIAHDLADVERDERRVRAAKRTETKAREGEESEPAESPPSHLRGRVTLLIAAGLTVLMALSAWNFMVRSRLQDAQDRVSSLRRSVPVLQEGQAWPTTRTSTDGIVGEVRTLDQELAIAVTGLVDRGVYGLYLLDADDNRVMFASVEATDGVVFEVIDELTVLDAYRLRLIRADEVTADATGDVVFEAARAEADDEPRTGIGEYPQVRVGADSE